MSIKINHTLGKALQYFERYRYSSIYIEKMGIKKKRVYNVAF